MKPDISKVLNQEDAIKFIVQCLNEQEGRSFTHYGYDLYLPNVMRKWCRENSGLLGGQSHDEERFLPDISPYFYDASWELCRMGVLRPGIQYYGRQSTEDGSAGNGYSITPFGTQWLSESDHVNFVPTEPGRFTEMMSPYAKIFGPGFHERAQQAVRCYGSHTYLACCVMCGAAAESILLHLAIVKDGNEERILKAYRTANGRRELENLIIGQQKGYIKDDFEICFGLLKYWRDEAAHGRESRITESESYTSLALLLRCAQFAKDNYEVLTTHKVQ